MHNTIISLALLKVNWDHLKKDYLENFLPFLATLCVKKDYSEIDVGIICNDFTAEYGLKIPYHPMISILDRARKRGVLMKSRHMLYPIKEKIIELDFTETSKELSRQHEKVMKEFTDFAKANYSLDISHEDAEQAFIVMLQERDLEILFAADEGRLLPEVESKKDHQFILYRFIKYVGESEPELFSFILNMAVGHILANAILYSDFTRFEGKLTNIELYFDTRFVLRVLGTEGIDRQHHYLEFLSHLLEEKVILRIYRHTFDEVMTVLNGCLKWVENSSYDPTRASITCNYFVQNGYKESDVERFIVTAESKLREYKIDIIEAPDPNKYSAYQIDEDELKGMIIEMYRSRRPLFDEFASESTLQKDIKSISSIYRFRRGRRPHSLPKVGSLFVTTNFALAHASNLFERAQDQAGFVFPACITDVFLGTFVWLQSPARVTSINRRKMIADCYAALQPSKSLLKKYRQEIDKLRKEEKITEDEYYMLRQHRAALNLLEDLTLGDPDNFSEKTPEEILEAIKRESQAEPVRKYLEVKDKLDTVERDLTFSREELGTLKSRIHNRATTLSTIIGWSIFSVLGVFFCIGVWLQTFEIKTLPLGLRVIFWAITGILGTASVLTGFNIKGLRETIIKWIGLKLASYFDGT